MIFLPFTGVLTITIEFTVVNTRGCGACLCSHIHGSLELPKIYVSVCLSVSLILSNTHTHIHKQSVLYSLLHPLSPMLSMFLILCVLDIVLPHCSLLSYKLAGSCLLRFPNIKEFSKVPGIVKLVGSIRFVQNSEGSHYPFRS